MYCVISWDISASNPRWQQINEQLLECLEGYTHLRPVNTFYLMRIPSVGDIADIQACLNSVRERTKEAIVIILSPALSGHTWSGNITNWTGVNAITRP